MSYEDLPIEEIKEELNKARFNCNLRETFTTLIRGNIKDFEHTFDSEWKEFVENVGVKPSFARIIGREIDVFNHEVNSYHDYEHEEYEFLGI